MHATTVPLKPSHKGTFFSRGGRSLGCFHLPFAHVVCCQFRAGMTCATDVSLSRTSSMAIYFRSSGKTGQGIVMKRSAR